MIRTGEIDPLARKRRRENLHLFWRDRWFAWRDRLLADQRFQRWAAGFPLTRQIAEKRARALFDLCAGFVYSQVLLACVELHIFDILAERPQTTGELSRRLSLDAEATARLLNAAAALRLVERRSGKRFGLGVLGAALLGNPAIAAMIEHHELLYSDLRNPVALLRGPKQATALSKYWSYARADEPDALARDDVAEYSALMSASQALIAEDVLDAWPLARHRCMLDVGGGDGTFLIAAATRAPNLRVMLYDLPAVADLARERLSASGLAQRASVFSGNFFTQPLPNGADLITLVRVLHDHDDADVVALLHNIRRALPDDGLLLIAEPMTGAVGADVIGDAYFGFYLLAMGSGRARSADELARLLRETGFDGGRPLATRRPMLTGAVLARPVHSSKWT
jgi:demethylspheroidene O-methyltransferase